MCYNRLIKRKGVQKMNMYRVKHRGTTMAFFLISQDVDMYIDDLLKIGYRKEDFEVDEVTIEKGDVKHE